ncbi:MAG TPA: adenylate/guanylate cyclase domain-containing protein, partial [Mycobacterium sp.]|nr:adenylate/guanylate cyclase domain-containing protein [Mycobacterium sp.]
QLDNPARGLEALRRGLLIAQQTGNRNNESLLAAGLSRLEAQHGDPVAALDHFTLVIRNYHDAGNIGLIPSPIASLAVNLDRVGLYEPAATLAGFAVNPFTTATVPELSTAIAHLREVLSDESYDAHRRKGEAMTAAEAAMYAYDQIDQARTALTTVQE